LFLLVNIIDAFGEFQFQLSGTSLLM